MLAPGLLRSRRMTQPVTLPHAIDRIVATLEAHPTLPFHELPARAKVDVGTCHAIIEALAAYNIVQLEGQDVRYLGT